MNNIIIKGRLSTEVELKTTNSGKEVAKFSVAVSRRFDKDKADFFSVTAWEKTAVFVSNYFRKGQEILIQGEMQSRKYEDKAGNKRIAWDIVPNNIEFCGSKMDNQKSSYGNPVQQFQTAEPADNFDSIGFEDIDGSEEDLPF